jgi:hypothetical protein
MLINIEISYIENILKFEFEIERHYKKLKSKLGKLNISTEKKYKLEVEEPYDDYRPASNNHTRLTADFGQHILKAGKFISDYGAKDSTSDDEDIDNNFNRVQFFNEESILDINKCDSDNTDFSGIMPFLNENNKNITGVRKKVSMCMSVPKKDWLQRIDEFSIPRTQSKRFKEEI